MSCCGECADNLGLMGLLPSGLLYGMRGLGQLAIPDGSEIKIGFRYSCAFCLPGSVPEPSEISKNVAACLQGTGAFYYVSVQISKGVVYQDYAIISGQVRRPFNTGQDLAVFIREQLNACYPAFASLIDDNDPVEIKLPASVIGQAPPVGSVPQPGGGASMPSFGQQISSLLGGAGGTGGLGTTTLLLLLVGAVVLAKALK